MLAAKMLMDSTQQGPNSIIDRTGNACCGRMKKLLDTHRVCLLFVHTISASSMEEQSGKELWNASMKSLVPRAGTSVHEKQGQHNEK